MAQIEEKLPKGVKLDRDTRPALLVAGGVGLVVLALAVFAPNSFLHKLYFLDGAVCAQRPAHSYFFDGQQLPVEARMVGIFGGFALTWFTLWFVGRGRAGRLPHRALTITLAICIATMVIDGLNATAYDMRLPILYEPQNWLRLVTGTLSGIGLAALIQPIFNYTVWKNPYPRGSLRTWRELAALVLGLGALLTLATLSGWGWLFWPLTLLSSISGVFMLTVLNLLIYTGLRRREGFARDSYDLLIPAALVFLFSLGEFLLFASGRILLMGSPFF